MNADWFAGRLRELREEAGLTQQQLGERAGLSQPGIADLEQQRRKPAWETVVALCQALGVTPDAFVQEPAERSPAGRGRPRKSPAESVQPAPKRDRPPKRPTLPGPVVSTPAPEQQAVPSSGGRPADELPPAQHKPKQRRTRRPRG